MPSENSFQARYYRIWIHSFHLAQSPDLLIPKSHHEAHRELPSPPNCYSFLLMAFPFPTECLKPRTPTPPDLAMCDVRRTSIRRLAVAGSTAMLF